MKLQIATDVVMQTYNPVGYDPVYAYSVTREPIGNGRYRITASLVCGNPFGCGEKKQDVRAALLYYVKTGVDVLVNTKR